MLNPSQEPYVVGSILYGADDLVREFVRVRIRHMVAGNSRFGPSTAIGVIRRGVLVGGVVWHNYQKHDIELSAAFDTPAWCLPQTLRDIFAYPFLYLGVVRITTITGRKNKPARRFDERVGFRLEGVIRKGLDGREDNCVYGMTREECRWIKDK